MGYRLGHANSKDVQGENAFLVEKNELVEGTLLFFECVTNLIIITVLWQRTTKGTTTTVFMCRYHTFWSTTCIFALCIKALFKNHTNIKI